MDLPELNPREPGASEAAAVSRHRPSPRLTDVEDVHGFVKRVCFKTGPPGTVGIESEWFVVDPTHPDPPVAVPELQSALAGRAIPRRSLVPYEPGGQLELSSAA